MNDKGSRYALAALRDKRANLASEIVQLEGQLRHRRSMLVHVDATLQLLDPSIDVGAIKTKRPIKHINLFRQGQLGRLIVDALRRASGPMATAGIVTEVMTAGGHGEEARAALGPRVRGNLAYLERRRKVRKTGTHHTARWALAD